MSFEAENDLERALMRAPTEPEARPEFYRLLLDSQLFVIGQLGEHTPEHAEVAVKGGERLMIATIAHDGRNYHPLFSALSRLQNFVREEVQYLSMTGRQLFDATRGAHFILNPGSEVGKELQADEIAGIMGSTRVMIGQPTVYPQALVDGLKELFARDPGVVAAYLIQVAFESPGEQPHPLIGVETEGDWQALSAAMGEVLKTAADSVVDLVPIERAEPTAIVQALLKTTPFYTRS
jgi:SseB protein C-terminal domain/SseB protein N-terminal domain